MKRKVIKILFILLVTWFGYTIASQAAISAESKTVKSGETVQIRVTSNQKVGAYSLTVTNNGGATFQSVVAPEGATAGGTTVTGASTSGITLLGTYTFKVPVVTSEQKCQIEFSATGMETPNLETISPSFTTATITVKPTTTTTPPSNNDDNIPQESNPGSTPNTTAKSSNNYLSSLKVSEGTLSPEFNFRTYQYTVNVGKEVESIKVTASAEHNKAKVSGTGTKTLKPGENKINVTVKAEDGKSRTYTIVVNKPTEEEPQEVKVMLKSLVVKGVIETEEGEETLELPFTPDFASDVFEYEILLDEALEDIIRLDIEAIGEQEDYTIDISGNEEITEGENIVTITVKSKDGQNVATYKILVTKPEKVMPISASVVDNEQQENPPLWNTTQKIFITVFTAITAILGIIFGVIEYRHSKKKGENKTAEIPFSKIEEKPKEDKTETLQEFFNADKEEKKEKKERKSKEEKVDKKESTIDKFDKEEKPTRGKGKHF
ncbi:MAG: cadherin-like beta sandwich domain-containing protein [Clostridia bacterium]|nr:cadherin-like beta sandwich domain-containing protein [Clostridia bacterium]